MQGALPPAIGLLFQHIADVDDDGPRLGSDRSKQLSVVDLQSPDFILEYERQAAVVCVRVQSLKVFAVLRLDGHLRVVQKTDVPEVERLLPTERVNIDSENFAERLA